MIRFAILAMLAAAAAAALPARAADQPAIFPTRDVDVTYSLPQPGTPPGTPPLEQRMRYSASAQKQRVDPPVADLYVVMDFAAHRVSTVRPNARVILDMPTAATAGATTARQNFTRRGQDTVAGLACAEWTTVDAAGEPADVCITADGVLLRALAAGRVLLLATSVRYLPQPPEVFAMPDGYKRLAAPPLPGK